MQIYLDILLLSEQENSFQSKIFGRLVAHDFCQQWYNGITDGNNKKYTNELAMKKWVKESITKNEVDRLFDKYQYIYVYEVYPKRIVTDARKEAGRLLRVVVFQYQGYDGSGIEHGAEFDLRNSYPR